jgi:hypothetical protein
MAKKKVLTEEQKKEIQMLVATNEMLNKSKEEAVKRGKTAAVKQIERAEQENINRIKSIDPSATKNLQTYSVQETKKKKEIKQDGLFNSGELDIFAFDYDTPTEVKKEEDVLEEVATAETNDIVPRDNNETDATIFYNVGVNAQFDVVPLPSNGQCYKSKLDRVPVSYLTAYDENIITSPNLYKDGLVIDYLLKNKVESNDINVDDLVSGDADAIILFLRATSYGTDFPVSVTDPETGEEIETTIDLSKIKTKKFTLKGDENGYFPYVLPKSKMEVKFRYLTRRDENDLKLLTKLENDAMTSMELSGASKTIYDILRADTVLDQKEKAVFLDITRNIIITTNATIPTPIKDIIPNCFLSYSFLLTKLTIVSFDLTKKSFIFFGKFLKNFFIFLILFTYLIISYFIYLPD